MDSREPTFPRSDGELFPSWTLLGGCVVRYDSAMEGNCPRFVALITDGNGRWAQRRGLPVWEGHRAGAENVRERLRDAVEFGVKELTVYAFSTENWSRSAAEVGALMDLMSAYLDREVPKLHREGVRIRFIGRRRAPVPAALLARIERAEQLTDRNDRITLVIPFNYGGRAEIVDAARTFTGTTELEFRRHLYAPELHDPDVVIRTGGEHRLSNYLVWQLAYARMVVHPALWPDFGRADFEKAISSASSGGCDAADWSSSFS